MSPFFRHVALIWFAKCRKDKHVFAKALQNVICNECGGSRFEGSFFSTERIKEASFAQNEKQQKFDSEKSKIAIWSGRREPASFIRATEFLFWFAIQTYLTCQKGWEDDDDLHISAVVLLLSVVTYLWKELEPKTLRSKRFVKTLEN